MDLSKIFSDIKETFKVVKKVDFEEYKLHIEMEPLTTTEEIKVLGACADYEGAQYIEGLKKHSLAFAIKKINNIDISSEDIEEKQPDGTVQKKSKYLVMCDQLGEWPAAVRDVLWDAFNNMQLELESKINKNAYFERFHAEEPEEQEQEDKAGGLKKIRVPDTNPDMTDVEKMSQQAKEEVERVQSSMARTNIEAETKAEM